jgi:hypothetical protein
VPSSDYEGNSNKCPQQKAVLCKIGGQQLSAQSLPFPEVPMPANISAFEQLIIGYVDKQVLGMLSKMSHLLTNVNCIWLDFDEDIPGQDTVALSMLQKAFWLISSNFHSFIHLHRFIRFSALLNYYNCHVPRLSSI